MIASLSSKVVDDLNIAMNIGLFVIFTIILVFPHNVPKTYVTAAKNPLGQVIAIIIIFVIMFIYGPLLGLLCALAYLFVWSMKDIVPETKEKFQNIKPYVVTETPIKVRTMNKHDKKWFIERALNEEPYIIEEDLVKTRAVQDDSEHDMSNSHVSH
jgi:hypothetical protein